ncbi:MAG: hypothetical protein H6622_01390 [Halobacteriovoraceae bacterium]|nr:hypothetical protein [Halobacteriovoraceae bacterium]
MKKKVIHLIIIFLISGINNAKCIDEHHKGELKSNVGKDLDENLREANIYTSLFGLGLGRKVLTGEFSLRGGTYMFFDILGYGLLIAALASDEGIKFDAGDGTFTVLGWLLSSPSIPILVLSRISQFMDNYHIYKSMKYKKSTLSVVPINYNNKISPVLLFSYRF